MNVNLNYGRDVLCGVRNVSGMEAPGGVRAADGQDACRGVRDVRNARNGDAALCGVRMEAVNGNALVRDDLLGKLVNWAFNLPAPSLPAFTDE